MAEPGRRLAVAEHERAGGRAEGRRDQAGEQRPGLPRGGRRDGQVLAEDPADDELGALGVVPQRQPDQGVEPQPVRVGVDPPAQSEAVLDDAARRRRRGQERGGSGAGHGVSTGAGVRGA